ncbi:MAG: helix-turn-helix domain-containing protein [Pontiella sp.]
MTTYSSSDSTKTTIIHAAGELAAELGFTNVTTRAVADRSGENIGSIHYHFGGKDGLFEAVIREAMGGCCHEGQDEAFNSLDASSTPEQLSGIVRWIIESEITDMFRSDRPAWHVPVMYQLLQRDDHLYDIFHKEVMESGIEAMARFLRIINPKMDNDEIHLHTFLMKMPIFAHADYMKAMLKLMKTDHYSEAYLQKMEDLLVRQAQLVLGLPEDKAK